MKTKIYYRNGDIEVYSTEYITARVKELVLVTDNTDKVILHVPLKDILYYQTMEDKLYEMFTTKR